MALNHDFHTRGRRVDEQVDVLRQLWTDPLIQFEGEFHTIPDAGLNPLPVQRPIPIWFGGHADVVLRRIARKGDGWLPNYRQPDDVKPELEKLARYLEAEGRTLSDLGIEPRIHYRHGDPETWANLVQAWRDVGATHLSLNTMGCGFDTPGAHLNALRNFAAAVGVG